MISRQFSPLGTSQPRRSFLHGCVSLVKRPRLGRRFGSSRKPSLKSCRTVEARKVSPIVANAGLYNAFLGVGLVWSASSHAELLSMKLFLLSCVAVAGLFGAFTLKWSTLLIQTLPSLVAIWLLLSTK
jgi:uncharacterized membrane protein